MNLSELRYALAVAHERNFRRAAERCFISQPALSTAVQKLEEELGVQIFERSRTEVSLTSIGRRIVEQAQRTLEEAERIRTIAREGQDQRVGVIPGPVELRNEQGGAPPARRLLSALTRRDTPCTPALERLLKYLRP